MLLIAPHWEKYMLLIGQTRSLMRIAGSRAAHGRTVHWRTLVFLSLTLTLQTSLVSQANPKADTLCFPSPLNLAAALSYSLPLCFSLSLSLQQVPSAARGPRVETRIGVATRIGAATNNF